MNLHEIKFRPQDTWTKNDEFWYPGALAIGDFCSDFCRYRTVLAAYTPGPYDHAECFRLYFGVVTMWCECSTCDGFIVHFAPDTVQTDEDDEEGYEYYVCNPCWRSDHPVELTQ